jgi:hypothetical protein
MEKLESAIFSSCNYLIFFRNYMHSYGIAAMCFPTVKSSLRISWKKKIKKNKKNSTFGEIFCHVCAQLSSNPLWGEQKKGRGGKLNIAS